MISPVMPDEYEDALALIGHQVDVAQRLRDPHQRRDADANDKERTKVVRKIYRPIDPIRLRVPARDKTPARAALHAGVARPVTSPLPGLS